MQKPRAKQILFARACAMSSRAQPQAQARDLQIKQISPLRTAPPVEMASDRTNQNSLKMLKIKIIIVYLQPAKMCCGGYFIDKQLIKQNQCLD